MDALVHLIKTRRVGGTTTGDEPVLETSLWGVRYVDDAGIVSHSPEQLLKMMGVIVGICPAFDLTVSGAVTEIMCLRIKGMSESIKTFSVGAAGQVYNQTNELVHLGGNVLTCPLRPTGANAMHGAASGSTHSNCTTDRALP